MKVVIQRKIHRTTNEDQCRLCRKATETIHHITSGCVAMAPTKYLHATSVVLPVVNHGGHVSGVLHEVVNYHCCSLVNFRKHSIHRELKLLTFVSFH